MLQNTEIIFWRISHLAAEHYFEHQRFHRVMSRLLAGEAPPFDVASSSNCSASDESSSSRGSRVSVCQRAGGLQAGSSWVC